MKKLKTMTKREAWCAQLEEQEYVKKSSFLPRLPEKFCPNKLFGRKKPHPFSEHFSFNICQNWMNGTLA